MIQCGRELPNPTEPRLQYHPTARFHLRASDRIGEDSTVVGWFVAGISMQTHRDARTVRREWSHAASAFKPSGRFHLSTSERICENPVNVGWFRLHSTRRGERTVSTPRGVTLDACTGDTQVRTHRVPSRFGGTVPAPRAHYNRMVVDYLRPSNEPLFVMRYHGAV